MQNNILINKTEAMKSLNEIIPKDSNFNIIYVSPEAYQLAGFISQNLNTASSRIYSEYYYSPISNTRLGLVDEFGNITMDKNSFYSFELDEKEIKEKCLSIQNSLILKGEKRPVNIKNFVKDKNILLVKESIESGLKAFATIETLKILGAKSISLACISMPEDMIETLEINTDNIYCPHVIENFVKAKHHLQYDEKIEEENTQSPKEIKI